MKAYLITFRSITYAQRAESALQRQGIRGTVRRTPRWMEERGCGYALEVKLADSIMGTSLLDQQGIPYKRVYRLSSDGTVEEA